MRDENLKLIDRSFLRSLPLPPPDPEQGKAGRGKLLLVAGSSNLPGAAILAARPVLRVGCGTVRLATPRSVAIPIGVAVPELMVVPLPETEFGIIGAASLDALQMHLEACDAAIIGPGLGDGDDIYAFVVGFLTRATANRRRCEGSSRLV
jgi:ADP-dependent NAD(P)H-hydrate dehydratase